MDGDSSGTARWQRIAVTLRAEIGGAALPPGARLPTEAELSARFGVNRHTVRRALDELSRGGAIRVEQGRGAFVADEVIDFAVEPRTRFSEWVRRQNREPGGTVLRAGPEPAPDSVAAAFGLAPGSTVLVLARLGLADGVPVSLGLHHFLPRPGLEAALRAHPTVTAALAASGIPEYRRRSTRVTARLPTRQEAALLRLPHTRPLLACENVNVDGDDTVIEVGLAAYPSSRVQLVFEP